MADSASGPSRAASSDLSQRSDFMGAVLRFYQRSYAADYATLITIFVLYILIQIFMEPFHRMFSLDNLAISFPHAQIERVPPGWLVVYAGAVPLLVVTIWAFVVQPGSHKTQVTFLGLLTSVFLTVFLTDIIKNFVGRPRPDLLDRCKAATETPRNILVDFQVCTETNHHLLHDGWRSFPSGHSSFSFSGLGYITLFFSGQTHSMHPSTPLLFTLFTFVPLLGALLIAISRCEDYRHDVWDVTAGSLLGLTIALFAYRRYYPSLWSKNCDVPHPSKDSIARAAVTLKRKGNDEEDNGVKAEEESGDEGERAPLHNDNV